MKKLFMLLLALMLVFSVAVSMTACGEDLEECTNHTDADSDGKCDDCGEKISTDDQNPGGQNPGGQNPGGDNPNGDNPNGDNPNGDNPNGDNPNGDNPNGDNPNGDNPNGDNPNGDNPNGDNPNGDNPGGDNPGGDTPGAGIPSGMLGNIDVAQILYDLLGEVDFEFYADEDTEFIIIDQVEEYSSTEYEKAYIALRVLEFAVNTKQAVPGATFAFEYGLAFVSDDEYDSENMSVTEFAEVGSVHVALVDDKLTFDVSLDDEEKEGEYDVNELFYTAVASMVGMTYDDLMSAIYIGEELYSYLPAIRSMIAAIGAVELPQVTEEYMAYISSLLQSVGSEIITVAQDSQNNNVYSVNVSALAQLVEAIEDKTIEQLIDEAYGEGATAAIKTFITSIPNMTVRDIAETAITFAESYGINVSETYALIDYIILTATGMEFDIEAALQSYYDMTLAEIFVSMTVTTQPGVDLSDTAANISTSLGAMIDTYTSLTVDQLYNLMQYGDIEYKPDGETVFSVTAQLEAILAQMNEIVSADITFDQNGVLVSAMFDFAGVQMSVEDNGDGSYTASYEDSEGVLFEVTAGENGISAEISNGVNEISYDVNIEKNYDSEGNLLEVTITADAVIDGDDIMDFEAIVDHGMITKYALVARTYSEGELVPIVDIEYLMDGDSVSLEVSGVKYEIVVEEIGNTVTYYLISTVDGSENFVPSFSITHNEDSAVYEFDARTLGYDLVDFVVELSEEAINADLIIRGLADNGTYFYTVDLFTAYADIGNGIFEIVVNSEVFSLDVNFDYSENSEGASSISGEIAFGDGSNDYFNLQLDVVDDVIEFFDISILDDVYVESGSYYTVQEVFHFSYNYLVNDDYVLEIIIIDDVTLNITTTVDGSVLEVYDGSEKIAEGTLTVEDFSDGTSKISAILFDVENDNVLFEMEIDVNADGVATDASLIINGYNNEDVLENFVNVSYSYEINGTTETVTIEINEEAVISATLAENYIDYEITFSGETLLKYYISVDNNGSIEEVIFDYNEYAYDYQEDAYVFSNVYEFEYDKANNEISFAIGNDEIAMDFSYDELQNGVSYDIYYVIDRKVVADMVLTLTTVENEGAVISTVAFDVAKLFVEATMSGPRYFAGEGAFNIAVR